jgi:putative superfamily III holin-X
MHTPEAERGLGPAARQVAEHASTLARLEVELATLELKRKVAALGIGIGLVVGAALFGLYALGFGLAAAAAGIATTLPLWAALLIVFGTLVLLALVLGLVGLGAIRKGTPPVPEQAIAEAKLTTEAIRNGSS